MVVKLNRKYLIYDVDAVLETFLHTCHHDPKIPKPLRRIKRPIKKFLITH